MKIKITDEFIRSLKKLRNSYTWYRPECWNRKYFELKENIWSFIKLFRISVKFRPWDYMGVLIMLKRQISLMADYKEKYGYEIEETKIPKIERMRETTQLLDNFIKDDFYERCGYDSSKTKIKVDNSGILNFEREQSNVDKIFEEAKKLEEKEWKKLINNLSYLKEWWD